MLISLFFALTANLHAANICPSAQVIGQGVVASRFQTVALGCVVQVTPVAKPNLLYRDYWIDDRGRFLVFTSIPGDDIDKSVGMRAYFLFPRKGLPSFVLKPDGNLLLTLPSGQEAVFSGVNSRVVSLPGEFKEDPNVSLDDNGGLEIESFAGIRLDTGWKAADQAYKDPQSRSTFYDAHNAKCDVQNDEFFFYENMYYGEPNLHFPDDASLAEFLKTRCPNLDLAPLSEMQNATDELPVGRRVVVD